MEVSRLYKNESDGAGAGGGRRRGLLRPRGRPVGAASIAGRPAARVSPFSSRRHVFATVAGPPPLVVHSLSSNGVRSDRPGSLNESVVAHKSVCARVKLQPCLALKSRGRTRVTMQTLTFFG